MGLAEPQLRQRAGVKGIWKHMVAVGLLFWGDTRYLVWDCKCWLLCLFVSVAGVIDLMERRRLHVWTGVSWGFYNFSRGQNARRDLEEL